MSIGTGTHFEAPVLGRGDLYDDVPIDILSRIHRTGYFCDFVEPGVNITTGSMVSTTLTGITSSTVLLDSINGVFRIVTNGVDANGVGSLQPAGSSAPYAPARAWLTPATTVAIDGRTIHNSIYFGTRVAISDYSNCDWFIGLAGVDTTIQLATGLVATTGCDNFVGFHHMVHANAQGGLTGPDGNDVRFANAGTAVANYQGTLSSASTVPVATPANAAVDGVYIEYGIRIFSTTTAEWYINRRLRHRRVLGNALASTLVPTWSVIDNAAAITFDIDYYWVSQTRV